MNFKEIKVLHDSDKGNKDAEKFNTPIKEALDNDENLFSIDNCIENLLGYSAPTKDKPFTAYKKTLEWHSYKDIPENCRTTFDRIFDIAILK